MIPTHRLRVLYDASLAGNPAGSGTYVRGLLGALQQRPEIDLLTVDLESESTRTLDTARKSPLDRARNSLRHIGFYLRTLPRRARQLGCDVIYCPTSLVPLGSGTPYLMTIFDLTPLRYPGTQDWLSRQYLLAMMRFGVGKAARLCTISSAVASEIGRQFTQVDPGRVSVTYPGPNPELLAASPAPVDLPSRPFALMVGTVEPRKNHLTALRALAEYRRRHPASDLMLVAAGSSGWHYGSTLAAIDDLGLRDHVVRLGSVGPASLRWLYREAACLLFPSLYEGFGLPVLEALYLECPVIASDIPSVEEIVGGTAPLLPATDADRWADALEHATAGSLRGQIGPGLERACRFTWDACAASAISALQAALP